MSKAAAEMQSRPAGMPFAVKLIPTLKRSPVGALVGLVLTGVLTLSIGVEVDNLLLEIPIALICIPGCMFIERMLDWRFSGTVDARMRHDAAHEDARRAFAKLDDYKARGVINKPDAYRLGAIIAKRDVAGGPRPGPKRSHHKKPSPPAESRPDQSAPATEKPAA